MVPIWPGPLPFPVHMPRSKKHSHPPPPPRPRSVRPPKSVLLVLVAVAVVGVVFVIFEIATSSDWTSQPANPARLGAEDTGAENSPGPDQKEAAGDPSPAQAGPGPEADASSPPAEESENAGMTQEQAQERLVTGRLAGARFALRMEGEPEPAEITIFDQVLEVSMPGRMVEFDEWLSRYLAADDEKRAALLPEGEVLVRHRRQALGELLPDHPQTVLLAALTPTERAALPDTWEEHLEKWVAGVGDFQVVEIAAQPLEEEAVAAPPRREIHVLLDDAAFQGVVYGSRSDRQAEKDASLFGIALDNHLVLHEGDFVFFPSGNLDPGRPGQIAVLYRGQWSFLPDPAGLEGHLQKLVRSTQSASTE